MRAVGLLIAGLLVAVLLVAFSPRVRGMLMPTPAEAPNDNRGDLKVWVNKRSGFYYCPSSAVYGTLGPGEFMAQERALETGFRLAPNVPCAKASTTNTASRSSGDHVKSYRSRTVTRAVLATARPLPTSQSGSSPDLRSSSGPGKNQQSKVSPHHVYLAHAIHTDSPQRAP